MAQKKASTAATPAEEYRLLDTSEITVVEELNSRFSLTGTGDLEADILRRGQIDPVICRRFGKEIILVAGSRRHRAITKINEVPGLLDTPMKVKALVREMDEREGFLVSISENRNREGISILDAAWQVEQLLSKYGMSQKDVAEQYDKDQSWVSRVRKLLGLPPDVRAQIASGDLGYTDALELLKMEEEEKKAAAQKIMAPSADEKPTRRELRSSTRGGKKRAAVKEKAEAAEATEPGRRRLGRASVPAEAAASSSGSSSEKRTLKQSREVFERWGMPNKEKGEERKPIHAVCNAIASFLDGNTKEKTLRRILTEYLK